MTHRHTYAFYVRDVHRRLDVLKCRECNNRRYTPLTPCACLTKLPDRAYSTPTSDCARCAGSGYVLAAKAAGCCCTALAYDERCGPCQRYEPSAGPIHTCAIETPEEMDHAAMILTGPSQERSQSATARGIGTSIDAEGNGERAAKAR